MEALTAFYFTDLERLFMDIKLWPISLWSIMQQQLFNTRGSMSYPETPVKKQAHAGHTRYTEPSKSHQHLQGRGFLCSLWNTLRKWKFRCAQGASCFAQLRFVHHISAGEDCAQAVPREAVENSFSENGFPHYCVSSFCSHSAFSSGLKGNSGLHFGG